MEKKFRSAITLMRKAGYDDIAAKLEKVSESLNEDTYRIAVVGEFKTGKSTLINRIFLKDDLLFTDILEATAVPTEVLFSSRKALEVIPYTSTKQTSPFDDKTDAEIISGEGRPFVINNPSPEDIRANTSADMPEERTRLARKIARVKLCCPSRNLIGLIVYDTPGINSVNEAVIATTYRIIPESDLVLFVKSAKQLSDTETEFLSGRVFGQGISRAIAVITYDPDAGILSPAQLESLLNTIRSQLASIGRSYIPVETVNIRDSVKSSTVSFRERIAAKEIEADSKEVISDVISDLLGMRSASQKKKQISEDETISMSALEEKLIRFIRDNVRPARMEKASQILKIQIRLALVRCSTELSAMSKTEAERRQMLADIRVREAETRLRYEKLSAEFRDELNRIERKFVRDMDCELQRIADSYIAGFDACQELGEMQNRLQRSEILLKRDMEDLFSDCSRKAENKIREMIESYGVRSQVLLYPWQSEISRELAIDGGILSGIPPFAILALDMLLFVQFGPFGPLGDILIRLVANYIPLLNKALPAAIATAVLKHNIRDSLRNQFEKIRSELPISIEKNFKAVGNMLISEWNAYAEEQLDAVRKSVETTIAHPFDRKRQALLEEVKKNSDKMLASSFV